MDVAVLLKHADRPRVFMYMFMSGATKTLKLPQKDIVTFMNDC